MLIRYGKNYSNEIIKDKNTTRNILSLIGHRTNIVENEVVLEPRNSKCICSTFENETNELNNTLYGLSAIDEQYPSSTLLDKFYVELVIDVIGNTVTLDLNKEIKEQIKEIYTDLIITDFGVDKTNYLIPIPRLERVDKTTFITVVGENWVIDYLTSTFLPVTIQHMFTINNYSMVKIAIDDFSMFNVKWLIQRLNTIHIDSRNVKIELNSHDLYYDTELTIQRVLATAMIQDEFKNIKDEKVFEVILNLI